jgi:hypothetical protein
MNVCVLVYRSTKQLETTASTHEHEYSRLRPEHEALRRDNAEQRSLNQGLTTERDKVILHDLLTHSVRHVVVRVVSRDSQHSAARDRDTAS